MMACNCLRSANVNIQLSHRFTLCPHTLGHNPAALSYSSVSCHKSKPLDAAQETNTNLGLPNTQCTSAQSRTSSTDPYLRGHPLRRHRAFPLLSRYASHSSSLRPSLQPTQL